MPPGLTYGRRYSLSSTYSTRICTSCKRFYAARTRIWQQKYWTGFVSCGLAHIGQRNLVHISIYVRVFKIDILQRQQCKSCRYRLEPTVYEYQYQYDTRYIVVHVGHVAVKYRAGAGVVSTGCAQGVTLKQYNTSCKQKCHTGVVRYYVNIWKGSVRGIICIWSVLPVWYRWVPITSTWYLVLYKCTKSRIEAGSGSPTAVTTYRYRQGHRSTSASRPGGPEADFMNFRYLPYTFSTFLLIQSILLPDIKIYRIYK